MSEPSEAMTDVPKPAPATTVPGPGREAHVSARRCLHGAKAEDVIQPQAIQAVGTHVPGLPAWCKEAPRRRPEGFGEDTLSVLERASRFVGIQAVHLVAAFGDQRRRS